MKSKDKIERSNEGAYLLNRSIESYKNIAKMIEFLGNDIFNLDIKDENMKDLIVALELIKIVDNSIDNENDENRVVYLKNNILNFIKSNEINSLPFFSKSTNILSANFREIIDKLNIKKQIILVLREIFKLDIKIKKTESYKNLYEYIKLEGQLTGELLTLLLGNSSSKEFKYFFKNFAGLGNCFDTVCDFKNDFNNKEIIISPSFEIYSYFMFRIFIDTFNNMKTIFLKRGISAIIFVRLVKKIKKSIAHTIEDNINYCNTQ